MTLLRALFTERNIKFVEAVDKIILTLSEFLLPFFDELCSDNAEKGVHRRKHIAFVARPLGSHHIHLRIMLLYRLRDKACKSLIHRVHTQSQHSVIDLMLECDLVCMPLLGHTSIDSCHITHSHPWEMSRASEICIDLLLAESELRPYSCKDSLTCDRRQRHVETVKGNPVDFLLPFFPAPERSSVTICTYIVIKAVAERSGHTLASHISELARELESVTCPACDTITVLKYKIIETLTESDC